MENKKNPNALTYGISPSAPASIKPVDIEEWKGKGLNNQFVQDIQEYIQKLKDAIND